MKYSIGDRFTIKKGRLIRNKENDGGLRVGPFISVYAAVWILMLFVDLLYFPDMVVKIAVNISVSVMILITCVLLIILKINTKKELDIGIIIFVALMIVNLFFQFDALGYFGNLPK